MSEQLERLKFIVNQPVYDYAKSLLEEIEDSNMMIPSLKITVDSITMSWPMCTVVITDHCAKLTARSTTREYKLSSNLFNYLNVCVRERRSTPINIKPIF